LFGLSFTSSSIIIFYPIIRGMEQHNTFVPETQDDDNDNDDAPLWV